MILADTIKGLTITIGADTKTFNKQLKQVDKDIKVTEKQADALTKSLQLEFDAGRFSQAQKIAQDAIEKTETKAQALRDQLKYLENTGADKTTENYKTLEKELYLTEAKALSLKDKLEKINELKLNKAIEQVQKVGDGITAVGKALTPISVAAAGVITGLTAIAKSTVSTGASIDDLSQQVGLNAEELQKWQYIAMQSGLEDSQLQLSLTKVQAAFADLASGSTSTATSALQELGFTAEDAAKGMDANFSKIIESLMNIKDSTIRASYANEIFGDKLGSKLIPLLNSGGQGLKQLTKEFENLGYMTNEQVSNLANFDDTLNRIKFAFSSMKNEIGVSLLPIMESLADTIENKVVPAVKKLTDWFSSLTVSQQRTILIATAVIAAIGPLLIVIGQLTKGVGGLVKSVQAIKGALDILATHPIVAVIAVIVGLLVLLYTRNEQFRESMNGLIDTLTNSLSAVLGILMETLSSVLDALMPLVDILLEMVGSILSPILDALTPIINALTSILLPVLNAIMAIIQPLVSLLVSSLVPAFEILGKVVSSVFGAIPKIINSIIKFIEKMVNNVIDFINKMIRAINKLGGWIGISLNELDHIYLQVSATVEDTEIPTVDKTLPSTGTTEGVISNVPSGSTGNVVNNDYSNKNITINVTVENYAEELDIDNIAEQINLKLAQQM